MKFMHISDVHLGVKPDAGKAWSEKRAQDIWDSFAEMIENAAEESPDFLLISGDLFHKQPLKRELKEVCGLFARIPQTKVLLIDRKSTRLDSSNTDSSRMPSSA